MIDKPIIRWGILGPGSIANSLAKGVSALPDAEVYAVGSRDPIKAELFADKYNIPVSYGSYQELVDDPAVDVVYVATPHPYHAEHTLMALNAGKPVLCEKPFTINRGELERLVRVAREKKLFLMEAMWTRYFPIMVKVRELVKAGAIGEVRMVQADFGFRAEMNPNGRLFDPALGGGALLDVGVYPISFAHMILGTPDRITGLATMCETGVDEQAAIVLGFPGGALALLSTAVRTETEQAAQVIGTEGRISIPTSWWKPNILILSRTGQSDETIELPGNPAGFVYEAEEVGKCLRAGKLESDVMTLDDSLAIMHTMDTLRAQWGLKYPTE
jgi:dihydrodiol dehydrogenase / D-xylose 1-dehydrogenase (NADP)